MTAIHAPTPNEIFARRAKEADFHEKFISAMNTLVADIPRLTVRDRGVDQIPNVYVDGGHEHAYIFYAGVSDDGNGFFTVSYERFSDDSRQDLISVNGQPFTEPFTFAAIIMEFISKHVANNFADRVKKSPMERIF